MNTPHEASARTPENTQDALPDSSLMTEKELQKFLERSAREDNKRMRKLVEWKSMDYAGL